MLDEVVNDMKKICFNLSGREKMLVYCLLIFIFLGCAAGDDHPPEIQLNSVRVPNQTEVVLAAGTAFNLSCHGKDSVGWITNTVRPLRGKPKVVTVRESKPQDTGTYLCGSPTQAWVHLYIRDTTDPSSVFVTSHFHSNAEEGEDFLLKCLLTDPSVTNITLQSNEHIGGQGGGLPKGMNVTFDPRKGFLIQKMQKSYSGSYVCSGWQNGRETKSRDIDLFVYPRLNKPPSVSVSSEQIIHLEGEKFEVTCLTSNPNHFLDVTWRNQNKEVQNTTFTLRFNKQLYVNKTLSITNVTQSHSGQYNCTARNEAGVAVATAHLKVLDGPYLRIHLQPNPNANFKTLVVDDVLSANVSNSTIDVDMASTDNFSSRLEVYEGRDVMLNVVIEAYPPIMSYHWMMQTHSNYSSAVRKQHYINNTYRLETGLQVLRVRPEDQGQYSLHISNSFFRRVINIDLRIFRSPATTVTQENNTLMCSSSGYPPPVILWFICSGIQDTCSNSSSYKVPPSDVMSLDEEEVRKPLPLSALPADDATAECVAYNDVGLSRDVFILPNRKETLTLLTPTLVGALSTATILLLLLLIVSYKLKQKPKYEIRWKIIETTDDGNNYTFLDPNQLPYNQKWEFPRDKLRLGAVLGSGAFGKVVEATAYGLGTNDVTRVAVKMLKPRAHSEERDALMSELKILSHLGYHDNIVNLLGACTRGGPMLMITEYCSHGDLLNFLRAHAEDYKASILHVDEVEGEVHYRNIWSHSKKGFSCCSDYLEMQPILSPGHEHPGEKDSLSMRDLLKFSYQVAQGMDFLATRNCIHRDVAARNVLLTDHHVAKICDFGLARDICNDDSYIVQGNARLPVKWMAPESIFQCIYTVQSDVWSYGVLLWEIFSLGKSPYPNIAVDTNFYKMIKDGGHMEQPDFAPAKMYQLMMLCWHLQPTDRPTFSTIGHFISRLLPSVGEWWSHDGKQVTYRNIKSCQEEEEDLLEMVKKITVQLP